MEHHKSVLREEARKHRSRTDFSDEKPEKAAALFWEKVDPASGLVIAGYWPTGREFDCLNILEEACERGYRCALPVVQKNSLIMEFHEWKTDTHMINGPFSIAQPEDTELLEPDIVIVPLLAFDRRGVRLGQGGGYYDATLEKLRAERKDVLAVGAAYASQAVLFNLPAEDHDQRLDMVVTPKDVHDFRAARG